MKCAQLLICIPYNPHHTLFLLHPYLIPLSLMPPYLPFPWLTFSLHKFFCCPPPPLKYYPFPTHPQFSPLPHPLSSSSCFPSFIPSSLHSFVLHSFLSSCIPSSLHSFLLSFIHSFFIPSSLHAFLPPFIHSFLPSFIPSSLPSTSHFFLPSYLISFLPPLMHSFLPSCFYSPFIHSFFPSCITIPFVHSFFPSFILPPFIHSPFIQVLIYLSDHLRLPDPAHRWTDVGNGRSLRGINSSDDLQSRKPFLESINFGKQFENFSIHYIIQIYFLLI